MAGFEEADTRHVLSSGTMRFPRATGAWSWAASDGEAAARTAGGGDSARRQRPAGTARGRSGGRRNRYVRHRLAVPG